MPSSMERAFRFVHDVVVSSTLDNGESEVLDGVSLDESVCGVGDLSTDVSCLFSCDPRVYEIVLSSLPSIESSECNSLSCDVVAIELLSLLSIAPT